MTRPTLILPGQPASERSAEPGRPVPSPAPGAAPDGGAATAQLDQAEAAMRQALGMLGARQQQPPAGRANPVPLARLPAGPRRHRFVQDGEVPVSVVATPPAGHRAGVRPNPAEPAAHRLGSLEAALRAEQAGAEQARRAHREALATIQDLRTKLVHAELARDEALARLAEASAAPRVVPEPDAPRRPVAALPKRKPGRPAAVREPKPVRWWLTTAAKPRGRKARSAESGPGSDE